MMKEETLHDVKAIVNTEALPQTRDQLVLREFILNFECLPELWDSSNEFYTHKGKRLNALKKLLTIYQRIKPDATIQETRNKINSLRSNYRKELRKIMMSKSCGDELQDEVYVPKSWVFYSLGFLTKGDPQINPKISSMPEDSEEQEHRAEKDETGSFLYISCSPQTQPTPKRKKFSREKQKDVLVTTYDDISLSSPSFSQPNGTNINPTALYWSHKLDNLDPNQRTFAEKAINDILFEAELGTLNRHSVQINVSL